MKVKILETGHMLTSSKGYTGQYKCVLLDNVSIDRTVLYNRIDTDFNSQKVISFHGGQTL